MIDLDKFDTDKVPLEYQVSNYDCGETAWRNALRYLFKRAEVSPVFLKIIGSVILDEPSEDGIEHLNGSSVVGMTYISKWLSLFSQKFTVKIYSEMLNSPVKDGILSQKVKQIVHSTNGVAILRVMLDVEHYVLLTDIDDDFCYIWDSWYLPSGFTVDDEDIQINSDNQFNYNRIIRVDRLVGKTQGEYSLVTTDGKRDLILIWR